MAIPQRLHKDPRLFVTDWACDGAEDDTRPGATEAFDEDSIVLARSGTYRIHLGSRQVVVDPGSIVFYRRSDEYRITHPAACGDRCTVLGLRSGLREELADEGWPLLGAAFDTGSRTLATWRDALELRALRTAAARGDALEAEEIGLNMIERILGYVRAARGGDEPKLRDTREAHRRIVDDTRALIVDQFAEPLTLTEISREVGASPFHLSRVFKRETGWSVHRYLLRVRLMSALDALKGGVRLTRVAHDHGFSSHSHFTHAFRRHFGTLPSNLLRARSRRSASS